MSLPKGKLLMRLVASLLCVLALSIYIMFAPAGINAASCTCGGGMDNLCGAPGQRCICFSENGVCTKCVWSDDPTCPCIGRCGGGGPGGN
jgi:hypothetical protein